MTLNCDPIIEYQMSAEEAIAYKMALLWCKLASDQFPDKKIICLRKKGDPRKSFTFKVCYSML